MMKRSILHGGFFGVALFVLVVPVQAANKAKPSSSSTDAVQEILRSETVATNSSVDRRAGLDLDPRMNKDVWWQSGYTQLKKQWLSYENSIVTGDDAVRLVEYRALRDKWSDQPDGQWTLATWCRKHGLIDQERVHLMGVLASADASVDVDSIYERLGCQKIGGVWVSEHERKEAAELKSEIERSHERWDFKLAALAQNLEGTPKAEKKLAEITQPSAVPAIVSTFCLSNQSLAEYGVRTLGQIPEYQASRALAGQAVFSPWKPVRTKATGLLKERKLTEFAPDLLMVLSTPIRTKLELTIAAGVHKGHRAVGASRDLAMNWDYIWIDETNDTMRVGIRRLFPISIPPNLVVIFSVQNPDRGAQYVPGTGQRPARTLAGISRADEFMAFAELSAQSDQLDYTADKMNDSRKGLNERVGKVLSACTNEPDSSDPKRWWNWWTEYSSVAPAEKKVVIVDERPKVPSFSRTYIQRSCLVAGTPVWTERGFVSIEQIRPGDRVLSKDVGSGELNYKPVLLTTVREPTPVQQFCVAGHKIVASPGHHFWVSGEGWTKMRELAAELPLHTVTGMQRITSVEDPGRVETVYNLVVADFHTYFVGEAMVLSHDVMFPALTNVKVPGLASSK